MSSRRHAMVAVAAILSAGWGLASVAEAGAKLIQMKNGRVLRAESVRTEGAETVATLEGGNTMAFPTGLVALVEDDMAGTQVASAPLNVIRSGRDGGAGGGFAPPVQVQPDPVPDEVEVPVEAPPPAQEQVNPGGIVVDDQPRTPAGPANVVPGPGPRNRRVNRLGFKPKPGDN